MSEISERDLRRRFSRQDDACFAPRVAFAVFALVAILGAGVAIVAVRRPVAPTTRAVSVPPPPPATTAARDDAVELAQRILADDGTPRPTAAVCHAMSAREREAASVDFGPTGLPCTAAR